jgi:hypothetical protein
MPRRCILGSTFERVEEALNSNLEYYNIQTTPSRMNLLMLVIGGQCLMEQNKRTLVSKDPENEMATFRKPATFELSNEEKMKVHYFP